MTDPSVLTAIIGGTVTILLAVIGIFGTIINAKLNMAERVRDERALIVDEKLAVIHDQTNSNLSKLNERLDIALARIEELQKSQGL